MYTSCLAGDAEKTDWIRARLGERKGWDREIDRGWELLTTGN
jgi:hypothetical protein